MTQSARLPCDVVFLVVCSSPSALHIKLVAFIIHLQHREMVEETRYFDTYEIVQQPNGNFYPYLARLYTEAFMTDIVSRGHKDCKN